MPRYITERAQLFSNNENPIDDTRIPLPSVPAFIFEEIVNDPDIFLERPYLNYEGYDEVSLDQNALQVQDERYGMGTSGTGGGSGVVVRRKSSVAFDDTISDDYTNDFVFTDFEQSAIPMPQSQLRALFVFHWMDNFFQMVQQICARNDIDIVLARSKEFVISNLNKSNEDIHIIIIDARCNKFFYAENVVKHIRSLKSHRLTTIIAVVKKNYYKKTEYIKTLLSAGVNKCMTETTSLTLCCKEIKQLVAWVIRLNIFICAYQILRTTLNRSKEGVLVTDSHLKIQFINKMCEQMLNVRFENLRNKLVEEIFVSDISSIKHLWQFQSLTEYEGKLIVKCKNSEGVTMNVNILPVVCIGRHATHYIFALSEISEDDRTANCLTQAYSYASQNNFGQHSIDFSTHASVVKLPTSESCITETMQILSQVQQKCSHKEKYMIKEVLEILKNNTLHVTDVQVNDLIKKSLRSNSPAECKTSSYSLFKQLRISNSHTLMDDCDTKPMDMKPIKDLLKDPLIWDFNIFQFEEVTKKRPLLYMGLEMFKKFGVFATLNVEERICRNWLMAIESHYHPENTYHNSTHAADVMQATGVFLSHFSIKDLVLDRIEEACALIAAAAHDIDHPGRSSAFLCNSDNPLAVLYNDLTVLESHHAALTFKLTLDDDSINIFKSLDKHVYKTVRSIIVDMILATEMTKHFEHLAKFVSVFGTDFESKEMVHIEEESSMLLRRMLIKVADVSNPIRPMPYCVEWGRRIAEEYFSQTEEEKDKNLPIVMPMFDRNTCSIPKSQMGFIDYIIRGMMHAWDSFVDMPELIVYLQANYEMWKSFDEQGIRTLAGVKDKLVKLKKKKKKTSK